MRKLTRMLPVLIATVGIATAQHGGGRGGGRMGGGFGGHPAGAPSAHSSAHAGGMAPQSKSATSRLQQNPALAEHVAPLLPAGMTAEQAAAGFKNVGQFVAALHVSKNLGIPFTDLRSRMTGENSVSLGKAVQELRPDLPKDQVRAAVKSAETEAKHLKAGNPGSPSPAPQPSAQSQR